MEHDGNIDDMYLKLLEDPQGAFEDPISKLREEFDESALYELKIYLGEKGSRIFFGYVMMGYKPVVAFTMTVTVLALGTACSNSVTEGVEFNGGPFYEECRGLLLEDRRKIGQECDSGVPECDRVGTYACPQGELVCVDEEGRPLIAPEVCDGHDNDCNGMTDEGFEGIGDTCTAGYSVGELDCLAPGTVQCSPSGEGVSCEARLGDLPQICDADHNGLLDNSIEEHFVALGDTGVFVSRNLVSLCDNGTCLSDKHFPVTETDIGDDVEGTLKFDFETDLVGLMDEEDFRVFFITFRPPQGIDLEQACGDFADGIVPAIEVPACGYVSVENGDKAKGACVFLQLSKKGTHKCPDVVLRPDDDKRIRLKLTP